MITKEELTKKRIAAISLGCDKNKVDLEYMLFKLKEYGFVFSNDVTQAEIVIVNTCGFILPARKEAIENIKFAISQKSLVCEKVVVSGCLPQRDLTQLKKMLPDVDYFVDLKENENIVKIIEKLYNVQTSFSSCGKKRVLTNVLHYAYVKIAEGCSNSCSYCLIPQIKGKYRSFEMNDIINEVKELCQNGVKEILLVAQDITRYGVDLYNENKLISLIKELCKIEKLKWIRLHYCYPELITDELLNLIVSQKKMCKYLDVPFQHVDNEILKSMNRRIDENGIFELINKIKNHYSQIIIRSTFIVGYPGETKKQFFKLCNFLRLTKLDNVGFFPYYREENTKAYFLKGQKSNLTKKLRLRKVQKIQEKIADEKNFAKLGNVKEVLIDAFDEKNELYYAHDNDNSPDVDFQILIYSKQKLKIGNFYKVELIDYFNRNLIGVLYNPKGEVKNEYPK